MAHNPAQTRKFHGGDKAKGFIGPGSPLDTTQHFHSRDQAVAGLNESQEHEAQHAYFGGPFRTLRYFKIEMEILDLNFGDFVDLG